MLEACIHPDKTKESAFGALVLYTSNNLFGAFSVLTEIIKSKKSLNSFDVIVTLCLTNPVKVLDQKNCVRESAVLELGLHLKYSLLFQETVLQVLKKHIGFAASRDAGSVHIPVQINWRFHAPTLHKKRLDSLPSYSFTGLPLGKINEHLVLFSFRALCRSPYQFPPGEYRTTSVIGDLGRLQVSNSSSSSSSSSSR